MHTSGPPGDDTRGSLRQHLHSPVVVGALCWMIGVGLGLKWGSAGVWMAASAAPTVAMFAAMALRRGRLASVSGLVALTLVGAAWAQYHGGHVPADHVQRWITPQPQLAQVRGSVEGPVYLGPAQRGPLAQFHYEPPVTLFVLRLDTITAQGRAQPASGRLLAKIEQVDHTLRPGMRVEATGWLSGFVPPANPGERDWRAVFAGRGIDARLTLKTRGNWRRLDAASLTDRLVHSRATFADAALDALRLGLSDQPRRVAFLELILLGRSSAEMAELSESFRQVGLAHILAISGAHLAIFMGLVAVVVRLLIPHPSRAALAMLAVLLLYLAAVPPRVPIVRAGIMAGMLCVSYGLGGRIGGIPSLAAAALLVLLWRPADLASAGFQLSFGVVAALLLFTRPVSHWLYRPPLEPEHHGGIRALLRRRAADCLAVSLVAFAAAMPLVAYHFELVSPLAPLLSLLVLPVVTATLGLGYLKIVAGLIVPSAGIALAWPLERVADVMTGLVDGAAAWPGSAIQLHHAPPAAWVLATIAFTAALFTGCFHRRRAALLTAAAICTLWIILHDRRPTLPLLSPTPPLAQMNMFAVGDGSCFLLRLRPRGEPTVTLMFDCGSQQYLQVGSRAIVPALRKLNVDRLDTVMISHADLDHYSGLLDVADAVPIGQVLVPPQLLSEAAKYPEHPTAFLLQALRERGLTVAPVARGWERRLGSGPDLIELSLLWPPADFQTPRANDSSLVLRLAAANRRLLLGGDIQQVAITELLRQGVDLGADVCDLPHHGSFVEASPRFIDAVNPRLVLQSSGPWRLFRSRWDDVLAQRGIDRLTTDEVGMVELNLWRHGRIDTTTFRAVVRAGGGR